MAALHILGDWHGPGEEKTARTLAAELPASWDVIAGRDVPDGMGTVDIDLIVVSPHAVFVCEEKAWGRHVVAGEVAWYVNGDRRHNPDSQVQHAARVLAGRMKDRVRGWRDVQRQFPRGHHAVRGHVVMSYDGVQIEGADELGHDVVLRLGETAATLMRLDRSCPHAMRAAAVARYELPARTRGRVLLQHHRPRSSSTESTVARCDAATRMVYSSPNPCGRTSGPGLRAGRRRRRPGSSAALGHPRARRPRGSCRA